MVGAEWTLTAHDIECLAIGAAILGCGGGGDPNNGRLRGLEMLRQGKDIKIINPCKYVDQSSLSHSLLKEEEFSCRLNLF